MSAASSPGPDAPPVAVPDSSQGKAGLVSIAILMSRVLGLVREVVLGGIFGGSRWMDAFMVAFRTPNMLRDLFAEGALSTAFVTTFSQKIKKEGDESAFALARKMLTLTTIFMSIVTGIGILLAPYLVRIFAYGWNDQPDLIAFTVGLSQIIYAFILMLSLAALVMGILNSKGTFFIPALASSFFNLGSILSGLFIGYLLEPEFFQGFLSGAPLADPEAGSVAGQKALQGMAIGVVIGGFCQLAVQLPSLRKIGFHFFPDFQWNDPGVKRVLSLMGPAIISGAAVQAGVALNTFFASFLDEAGSVSYLQWAFRLMQLPIGVFGVAIATVTLPAVSRAASDGINEEFRTILSRGIRLAMVLTVPSALGLALLAEPIIAVIWQRGRFDVHDTLATAAALRAYAFGLIFYAAIKIVQPAFYAIDKKWVPMFVSIGAILINAGLNTLWIFVLGKGHAYLALSTTIGAFFNFFALYFLMRHFSAHLHSGRLLATLLKLAVASFGLAAVCLLGPFTVLANWQTQGFLLNAAGLGATIVLAAVVYFITARILRVSEVDDFFAMVKRRTARKSP